MHKKKFTLLLILSLLIILTLVTGVQAKSGHVTLLSVSQIGEDENNSTLRGGTADVFLEIKPGNERIFIDTFPVSNIDTQISTRFAKDIACDFINRDCRTIDFFYTIRSNSVSIGGPSGGASIAVLTTAVLKNLKLNENVALTGTINSGGIIGPVGGVKEKVIAAKKAGITTVLIPFGTEEYEDKKNNETINLVELGNELNITVIPVKTLNEALFYFTGKKYEISNDEVLKSEVYEKTMKEISESICEKTFNFENIYNQKIENNNMSDEHIKILNSTKELINQSKFAMQNEWYYSAASSCFGSNIKFEYIKLLEKNLTNESITTEIGDIKGDLFTAKLMIENWNLNTVSDLQTYMVVSERIKEGYKHIDNAKEYMEENNTFPALYQLAYAKERHNSALEWSKFYGKEGKKLEINQEKLKDGCAKKINEASERLEYLNYFVPIKLKSIEEEISDARGKYRQEEYALCLFTASKVKAEADMIISAISASDNKTKELLQTKLDLAKNIILEEQKDGNFPFLGYSYYEYADLLKTIDPDSAMLYSQYALELSQIRQYFGEPKIPYIILNKEIAYGFILGSLFGSIIAIIFITKKKSKKTIRKKKHIKQKSKIKVEKF